MLKYKIANELNNDTTFINWVFGLYVAHYDPYFFYELTPDYQDDAKINENEPIVENYKLIAPIIYNFLTTSKHPKLGYFIIRNNILPHYMKITL